MSSRPDWAGARARMVERQLRRRGVPDERVLASQNEQEIKKQAALFKQKLDSLERWTEF